MLKLNFNGPDRSFRKVLCLGAHSDDIEIGCGGTILRLLEENPQLEFYWVVFSSTPKRRQEARKSAQKFLTACRSSQVVILNFRDSFFPYEGARIKKAFESLKKKCSPDLILTHYREDLHQDHRLISELTWNTFRNHLILEYEILKYDGDLGKPNLFVELDEVVCRKKIRNLLESFPSQSTKPWFTDDAFRALLRVRGVECNAPGKYAEAFYSRKALL